MFKMRLEYLLLIQLEKEIFVILEISEVGMGVGWTFLVVQFFSQIINVGLKVGIIEVVAPQWGRVD